MYFEINDEFKITGQADNVESNFTSVESYFKTKLTPKKINGKAAFVHAFMVAIVNKALDNGIKLPTPIGLQR